MPITNWTLRACYVCGRKITLVRATLGNGMVNMRHESDGDVCEGSGRALWFVPSIPEPDEQGKLL